VIGTYNTNFKFGTMIGAGQKVVELSEKFGFGVEYATPDWTLYILCSVMMI
jgi:hypothetical protein